MTIVLLIVSFIIAAIIVQVVRGLFMKIIGANVMFLSGYKQIIYIMIVAYFVFNVLAGH